VKISIDVSEWVIWVVIFFLVVSAVLHVWQIVLNAKKIKQMVEKERLERERDELLESLGEG